LTLGESSTSEMVPILLVVKLFGWQESVTECIRMCALKLQAKAKHFPHCKQLWGFFPTERNIYIFVYVAFLLFAACISFILINSIPQMHHI
jgi:hypothetical protein